MKNKYRYLNSGLITIIILSIAVNFNSFLMGSDSNLINLLMSLVYIFFWFVFIGLSRGNRNNLILSTVWSILTLACAVPTLAVNINDELMVDYIIPFAMIFLTPFYGLELFFNKLRFLKVSIIITIVSLTWLIVAFALLRLRGKRRRIEN